MKCVTITQPHTQPPNSAFVPGIHGTAVGENKCAKRPAGVQAKILFHYDGSGQVYYTMNEHWNTILGRIRVIPAGANLSDYEVRLGLDVKKANGSLILRLDTEPDEYPDGVHCFTIYRQNKMWFTHVPTGEQVVINLGPVSVNSGCDCEEGFT